MPRDALRAAIRRLPPFRAVDDAILDRLAAAARMIAPERGALIIREGQPCHALYGVCTGAVVVFRSGAEGRRQVLHRIGPGHTFAEAAALTMPAYPASAQAVADGTTLVEIAAEPFLGLFDGDPRLPRAMVGALCRRLHTLVRRVEELSVTSTPARLARYLLELPARDVAQGLEVHLPTTKREVAERLGITPETLSRQLRRWTDDALILSERDRIVLLIPEQLFTIANEG